MATNLVLHRGARLVERAELDTVDAPPATDTWFPLKHSHVVNRVIETLFTSGFEVKRQSLALSPDNHRFFGTLDVQSDVAEGVSLSVGVRNSTDKSLPIGLVAGTRVFVCDNLAFSSEIVVTRKHTRFGDRRFADAITRAVASLHQYQSTEARRVEWMQQATLSEDAANSYMLQAYDTGIVGSRLLPLVINEWREPQHDEFKPRTAWSLFNAVTEVLKPRQRTQPAAAAYETIRLQKLLTRDMPHVAIPS